MTSLQSHSGFCKVKSLGGDTEALRSCSGNSGTFVLGEFSHTSATNSTHKSLFCHRAPDGYTNGRALKLLRRIFTVLQVQALTHARQLGTVEPVLAGFDTSQWMVIPAREGAYLSLGAASCNGSALPSLREQGRSFLFLSPEGTE